MSSGIGSRLPNHERRIVACIGIFQGARLRAELSIEERYEPICARDLVNDVIKASKQIISVRESRCIHAQNHFD